jgi:hypothetical protein
MSIALSYPQSSLSQHVPYWIVCKKFGEGGRKGGFVTVLIMTSNILNITAVSVSQGYLIQYNV